MRAWQVVDTQEMESLQMASLNLVPKEEAQGKVKEIYEEIKA